MNAKFLPMSRVSFLFIILFTAFLFRACTEDINLKLDEIPPQLVIEGWITKEDTTPKWVKLHYTKPYLEPNEFTGLDNALVIVKDNIDQTDTFSWNPDKQRYEANTLKGIPQRTYYLTVHYQGVTYTSRAYLPQSRPIDTLVFVYDDKEGIVVKAAYRPVLIAKEPDTLGNYYRIRTWRNDTLQTKPRKQLITDDLYFNGNLLFLPLPYQFEKGDTCKIQLDFITKETYDFINSIAWQQYSDGVFSPPPDNVLSNIKSSDGSQVFGWFGALGNEYYVNIVP